MPKKIATLLVHHPDKERVVGVSKIAGMKVQHVESTGALLKNRFVLSSDGGYMNYRIDATREHVNATVRKMRPEEEGEYDNLTAQIRKLEQARRDLLALAWKKAHKVTVKELNEMANHRDEMFAQHRAEASARKKAEG